MWKIHAVVMMGLGMLMLGAAETSGTNASSSAASTNAPAASNSSKNEYKLNVQDKLMYSVMEDPVKGVDDDVVAVNAVNEMQFHVSRGYPESITINTSGKTIEQVKAELKQKLDENYYVNARVKLELRERVPTNLKAGKIYFTGEGAKATTLPLFPNEEVRMRDAILAVGYNEFANLKKVILTRNSNSTGKPSNLKPIVLEATMKSFEPTNGLYQIDVDAILKGDLTHNIRLQDGDMIKIPEKGMIFK